MQVEDLQPAAGNEAVNDAEQVARLDSAGAWVLQKLLLRLRSASGSVQLCSLRP